MLTGAAMLYALLALVVVAFQIALALGAPWGHLAMGGRFPGRFPPPMRLAALVQGALIGLFALIMLGRAGLISPAPPVWLVWAVVAVSALSAVMNLVTPSIPERRLWGPVTLVMLVCAVRVALG
jgi:hypothetical protein